jgi:hypothetical protein
MNRNYNLNIADILFELQSPLDPAELGIATRMGQFYGPPDRPDARISLRWRESVDPLSPDGELIYDPGSIWRMYRAGAEYYAAISYQAGKEVSGVLRANAIWDKVTLTERRAGAAWRSLLNIGAGELLLRTAILGYGGLVFHASGLDDNGRGLVFVGHSGAGKSTQAELWSRNPGVIAMNDDRIAVRVNAGKVSCYGTPWGGAANIACNHHAPLAALVLLEQAAENAIQPLSPSEAAPLLLARTFLPYWDQALIKRALANLNTILALTPVYRLRCRPEPAVIPLVRSVL